MAIVKNILIILLKGILCFLGGIYSIVIAAAACAGLCLEAGSIEAKTIFWIILIIQIVFMASTYTFWDILIKEKK